MDTEQKLLEEIAMLRACIIKLRDVVVDHNRSGAYWKTTELFGRMMDALANAGALLNEH